jgi:hypothetical protein
MSRMTVSVLAFLCSSMSSHFAFCSDGERETKDRFQAVRIDRPLQLTGKLDDPLWKLGRPVHLLYEIDPGENTPAPQQTTAVALYTGDYLYVGFRCFDTRPGEIRANVTDRDRIFQDDFVMVVLDTYGDRQRGYEFVVNPYGVQGDLMRTLNSEDETFDALWHSAAVRNDSGWTAEFAIPFKSLRFPNVAEQKWSVLLYRLYPRTSRAVLSWTKNDRNIPSELSQAGELHGLANIESGGSLEVLPYAMGQQAGVRIDAGDPTSGFSNEKVQGRIGGGIQYSPSSSFSLEAVVNPDFSQIETDAGQISVNTTFALSYQEKRPFFLTGQELLQTPMYYSRSINNPLGAARIIGKTGALSYLYLGAYDRNTPFDIPGGEASNTFASSRKSLSNIGRIRYEFGNESYLGSMIMTRDFSDGHNYLVGLDWNYKFWENWYFTGETFVSHTKEINDPALFQSERMFGTTRFTAGFDGEQYYGSGIHLNLSHQAREYQFSVTYNDFSPTYQTYNGLFSLTDYRQLYVQQGYTMYPQNSILDRVRIQIAGDLQFNHDGAKKEQMLEPSLCLQFKGQTHVDLMYLLVNDEKFAGVQFVNARRFMAYVNSEPWSAIAVSLDGQVGKFIYRTSAPEMGVGHSLSSTLTFRPTSKLKLEFSYSRSRLSSEATDILFFDGYILRTLAAYQFTSEVFLRGIVQYNSFDRSFNVYPLFSYKLNAFTTCYAGLTNDYLDFGRDFGFTTTARQFFMKLQYLLRS